MPSVSLCLGGELDLIILESDFSPQRHRDAEDTEKDLARNRLLVCFTDFYETLLARFSQRTVWLRPGRAVLLSASQGRDYES